MCGVQFWDGGDGGWTEVVVWEDEQAWGKGCEWQEAELGFVKEMGRFAGLVAKVSGFCVFSLRERSDQTLKNVPSLRYVTGVMFRRVY